MSVTRQEQREARCAAGPAETPRRRRAEQSGETYTGLIASWAKERAGEKLNNLVRFFSVENLRRACGELKGTKAVGSDGMTKGKYVEFLEENLQELNGRMRRMAYRPEAARRVLIPKPDGSKRPIAVSNFEDKIVQKVAADILTAIYDREFKRFSFGFRSGRSCHGAVGYLFNRLRKRNHCWVVDIDLKDFFGTIDHGKLMDILRMRISDKRLLRYLWRMLKAGILIEGNCFEQEQGTPQGSIVSPVLANIYLHHVLDEWFERVIRLELKGEIVRYADDFVTAFATKDEAEEFVRRLKERVEEFGLSLNLDKSRVVDFSRKSHERGTFNFLGFTFYWGRSGRDHRPTLKVRTSMKALRKKIQDFTNWIRENRSRYGLDVLWKKAAVKLQGHFNYYGVIWNRGKLFHFYSAVIWNLFRWLNRRSQKESYTWEGFHMRLRSKPLPMPTEGPKLIDLTDPMLYCA